MQRKYSTSGSSASGRSSTSAGPSTCTQASPNLSDSTSTAGPPGPPDVRHLGPFRIAGDHDPAVGVDTAGDGGGLHGTVRPGGDQHQVVPGPDEVEQLVPFDSGGGGDGAGQGWTSLLSLVSTGCRMLTVDGRMSRAIGQSGQWPGSVAWWSGGANA